LKEVGARFDKERIIRSAVIAEGVEDLHLGDSVLISMVTLSHQTRLVFVEIWEVVEVH
jgi:hypothetical protein